MKTVRDPQDPRLDKFYDETPQVVLKFQLRTTTHRNPFELVYKERLDGTDAENKALLENLKVRAQADMFNVLQRLQAKDEDCEFSSWRMIDEQETVLDESDVLRIKVK